MKQTTHKVTQHTIITAGNRIIRSGKFYTLIFLSKGSCYMDINGQSIFCGTEDAVLLKPNASTILHYTNTKFALEYLSVLISPDYLRFLSDESIHLEDSLSFLPKGIAHSRLDSTNAMLIKNIALQIIILNSAPEEYAHALFEKNLYSLLLIQIIRSFIDADKVVKSSRRKQLIIDDIFAYIANHLTEELSLEQLESEFHVSKYYICREFKRLTGLSPHAYIVKAKLNYCCKFIEQDIPINEVYQLGGFGGYNHFFRAFKKEYQMTPKEYYKSLKL